MTERQKKYFTERKLSSCGDREFNFSTVSMQVKILRVFSYFMMVAIHA